MSCSVIGYTGYVGQCCSGKEVKRRMLCRITPLNACRQLTSRR